MLFQEMILCMFQQMLQKDWKKNRQLKKGMDIKLAKTNIRKQVGGSLLTSILTLGKTLAPTLGKNSWIISTGWPCI